MRNAGTSYRLALTFLLVPVVAGVTATPEVTSVVSSPAIHKFHVSYGRMAVEGRSVSVELRFYRHDLEEALGKLDGSSGMKLSPDPRVDSLFLAYLDRRFVLEADGERLAARLIGSGEETDGRDEMWWYAMQYQAEREVRSLQVTSRLLFELFEDQRNILKLKHFPSEQQETFYFVSDFDSGRVVFDA